MTVVTNTKSTVIALLDATQPYIQQTAGEGGAANLKVLEDTVLLPTTFFSATSNWARVLRFPTSAKVKKIELFTDAAVDSAATTGAAVFQVGVVFSDSVEDGTPASYQNLQPTTLGIGGGQVTQGTAVAINGANANYIFGTVTPPANTGAVPATDITLGGSVATYGSQWSRTTQPLLSIFNFWDNYQNPLNDLGYFDLLIDTTHAYTTVPGTAANLYARMSYAL